MAEIVGKGQGFVGQRSRWVEAIALVLLGAAMTIAIGWVVFTASAPKVVTPTRTSIEYLQEPGLLQQRSGERGGIEVAVPGGIEVTVPGGTLLDPAMQEHRRGEREYNK